MLNVFSYLIVCLLLMGCASKTNAPAHSLSSDPLASPISTATPTPSPSMTSALQETPHNENESLSVNSSTIAPMITTSPQPVKKEIRIIVFHDFNANEIFDDEFEYLVIGAEIKADNYSCITDYEGNCLLGYYNELPVIKINILNEKFANLRYVFYENQIIKTGHKFKIIDTGKPQISIGLGEGPFAIPLKENSIGHYFDGKGNYGRERPDGTHHYAIDIRIAGEGPQPVFAVAEGDIGDESFGDCNNVVIYVRDEIGEYNINTGHLTEIIVKPGQHVHKGTIIGYIDPAIYENNINGTNEKGELNYIGPNIAACTNNPHLHMGVYGPGGNEGEGGWGWLNVLELFAKSNEFYAMEE